MLKSDRKRYQTRRWGWPAILGMILLVVSSQHVIGKTIAEISSVEFPRFRRIVIPWSMMDTLRPPLVSCIPDSGGKHFRIVIAPVDTSRFRGKTRGLFRGNRPVKYNATFPDSQTLNLAVQTTPFAKVQTLYTYGDKQIFIDIYNPPTPKLDEPVTPPVVPLISKPEPTPPKSNGIAGHIISLGGKALFLKALLLAALIIILGAGIIMIVVRLTRHQDAGRKVHAKPEKTSGSHPLHRADIDIPATPRPGTGDQFDTPESSGENDVDVKIRKVMQQQGITYDEARLMVWMQQRNGS